MERRWFFLLIIWLLWVIWGVTHCSVLLSRALGPEEGIQAFDFQSLPHRFYRVEIMHNSFTFRLPLKPELLLENVTEEVGICTRRWSHSTRQPSE